MQMFGKHPRSLMYPSLLVVFLFVVILAGIVYACPNGCSNKGVCKEDNTCDCLEGYTSSDCSVRVSPQPSLYDDPSSYFWTVGSAEYILGPSYNYPDGQLVSANLKGVMKTWICNGDALLLSNGTSPFSYLLEPKASLSSPNSAGWDGGGAWISRVFNVEEGDGTLLRGIYHAETVSPGVKSMGYCESKDGGETWIKPNYPNNQVLSSSSTSNVRAGAGDGSVIQVTDEQDGTPYYYLYYADYDAGGITGVARSKNMQPGSWIKYNNGWGSQRGVGGSASGLRGFNDATLYTHAPTREILTVGNDYSSPIGGAYMSVSKDGINFKYMPAPLYTMMNAKIYGANTPLPAEQDHTAYYSFMPLVGGSELGNTFYMYYMKMASASSYGQRYLVRRKITLNYNARVEGMPHTLLALTTYVHSTTGEQCETREHMPAPYNAKKILGYVATSVEASAAEGLVPIALCYNTIRQDYYLTKAGIECSSNGDVRKEGIGWMFSSSHAFTVPVYRCVSSSSSSSSGDTFLANNKECDGRAQQQTEPFGHLIQGSPLNDVLGQSSVVVGVADGSWKYTTSSPSSSSSSSFSWTQASFQDGAWNTGAAPFWSGYTWVKGGSSFARTNYWFRRSFSIDSRRTLVRALLTIAADDYATVYVNGVLVDQDTSSNVANYWNRFVWIDVSILQNGGQNVLAVAVANGDGYAMFDAQLTVYYADNSDTGSGTFYSQSNIPFLDPGLTTTVCASASQNNQLQISCPSGYTVSSVDFASFGFLESTTCNAERASTWCNSENSLSVVRKTCLNKVSCMMLVSTSTFSSDPCPGTSKSLTARVTCYKPHADSSALSSSSSSNSASMSTTTRAVATSTTTAAYASVTATAATAATTTSMAANRLSTTSAAAQVATSLANSATTSMNSVTTTGAAARATTTTLAAATATTASSTRRATSTSSTATSTLSSSSSTSSTITTTSGNGGGGSSSLPRTTTIICGGASEGGVVNLLCPGGSVITSLPFVSYGLPTQATPAGSCGIESANLACNASSSYSVVADSCLGRSSCSISSSNGVFGDPCSGRTKALVVRAVCTPLTLQICGSSVEYGADVTLACPSGLVMTSIPFASFGLPSVSSILVEGATCGTESINAQCHSTSSYSVVAGRCLGQASCRVSPSISVFGDPCAGHTKALAIRVVCSTPEQQQHVGSLSSSMVSSSSSSLSASSTSSLPSSSSSLASSSTSSGRTLSTLTSTTSSAIVNSTLSTSVVVVDELDVNNLKDTSSCAPSLTSSSIAMNIMMKVMLYVFCA
eukprot:TRINITY_DN6848_c2_g1_i2.p1 TRINITY_DN6848_c2_g1~~TRINITY_DN6848_c2_g1_i2.p1  ORF type:complete len:1285 (+),score=327.62 TRINITY_DN6848_c2_g1_i2:312-4166(+)